MKIDNSIKAVPGIAPADAPQRVGQGNAGVRSGQQGPDSGAVGHKSAELASIGRELAQSDGIDHAKVSAITQAIAAGQFRINPEAIADKLLEEAQALVNAGKGPQ